MQVWDRACMWVFGVVGPGVVDDSGSKGVRFGCVARRRSASSNDHAFKAKAGGIGAVFERVDDAGKFGAAGLGKELGLGLLGLKGV